MLKVTIIYHSGAGHTRSMAEAVFDGAASVDGVHADLLAIEGTDIKEGRWSNPEIIEKLNASHAIILGSPTYMGAVSGQMKCFMDATGNLFAERAWCNKFAAGFAVSGDPSGDKLNVLLTMFLFAMQHGMIWIGPKEVPFNSQGVNRLGFYSGAAGQAGQEPVEIAPNEQDRETGRLLGLRVASIVQATSGLTAL